MTLKAAISYVFFFFFITKNVIIFNNLCVKELSIVIYLKIYLRNFVEICIDEVSYVADVYVEWSLKRTTNSR